MQGKPIVFKMAPMSPLIWATTLIACVIPLCFLVLASLVPEARHPVIIAIIALFGVTYASVWLWFRPSQFMIEPQYLTIKWPLRILRISRREIFAIDLVNGGDFRQKYGYGMRVGAGGLWGGFGLLITRQQKFQLYVSRTDEFVIVHLSKQRPLLITPENPRDFIHCLGHPQSG